MNKINYKNKLDKLSKKLDQNSCIVKNAVYFTDEIINLIPEDTSKFNVLDYGSVNGLKSFELLDCVDKITGMDNSIGMIDVYNSKVKKLNFNNINSIYNDILMDCENDLVVTNKTMHNIKDTNLFINKLYNSIKIGGYLCTSGLMEEDSTFHKNNDRVIHFGFYIKNIKSIFKQLNLHDIVVKKSKIIIENQKSYDIFIALGYKI